MDVKALHTRATELKRHIGSLTAELEALAPKAVNGHDDGPAARKRIAEIVTARQHAAVDLEVAEAALRSPEYREQSLRVRVAAKHAGMVEMLDRNYHKKLRNWQAGLRSNLAQYYRNLVGQHGPIDVKHPFVERYVTLEELPRIYAANLTREDYVEAELRGINANGGTGERVEELEARLAAYRRHTDDLLAATTLPPVPEELVKRLAQPQHRPLHQIGG